MRALVRVVLVLAVLYAGYWFVGSRALERGAEAWFQQQAAAGFIAERESLSVQGFPSRFDLTVNGLRLADPATGIGWEAPFVQVFSLSYKPWHVIAAFAPQQIVRTPSDDVTLDAAKLQASVIVTPGPALALDRVALAGEGLRATSSIGWSLAADSARFATRRLDGTDNAHDIGIEATNISPDASLLTALGAASLPGQIDLARLTATASFSAPLDRHAGATRPQLLALEIGEGLLRWGDLGLFARGSLVADAQGQAEGRVEFRLDNWPKAVDLAVALGLMTPEVAPTWRNALTLLAAGGNTVEVPLTFAQGRMSLGPLPIGPAPRLH
ncbi:DUF2125 domain-containing protein [Fertoebacter nigrum]|uniref:DUF2125 domain-containing protein n=1 Tax=Fertoeibacter niger TaxID=2656921 RepID=A0A8X8KKM4_9RHOB|nr:DUF2125 domain-containing protein [Fertoeibacter niger]NUB44434.1 DUF2125 domain-containing protein [Fertoeibacter niger]